MLTGVFQSIINNYLVYPDEGMITSVVDSGSMAGEALAHVQGACAQRLMLLFNESTYHSPVTRAGDACQRAI